MNAVPGVPSLMCRRLLPLLALLSSLAAAPQEPFEIRVKPDRWGDAGVGDIRKVLESAARGMLPAFEGRTLPPLEVSRSDDTPITLFQRGPEGEIRIKLNVEGRLWARFAFQFAHELGHVACNYVDDVNPNQWFEETVCEVASLFALGRMAEEWERKAPYPNWKGYASSLRQYRDERIAASTLPKDETLPAWFRPREAALRKDPGLRELNNVMAVALLPLFEAEPARWAAVASLNGRRKRTMPISFPAYLGAWKQAAPEAQRDFIDRVAARFGVAATP
jgi:hypothetical protein